MDAGIRKWTQNLASLFNIMSAAPTQASLNAQTEYCLIDDWIEDIYLPVFGLTTAIESVQRGIYHVYGYKFRPTPLHTTG